jgi:hypothetical protein
MSLRLGFPQKLGHGKPSRLVAASLAGNALKTHSARAFLLHCMSPLLAQSGHPTVVRQCPLLEVKRTSMVGNPMSAFDP